MRFRWILFTFLLLALTTVGVLAQDGQDNPLLLLLRYVPNTPEYASFVTFGDAAAWYKSWGISRPKSVADLEGTRISWMTSFGEQTGPPDVLGLQYLLTDEMRSFYGFDLFSLDRYLQAGQPPDSISLLAFGEDTAAVGPVLRSSGYEEQSLDNGAALFSILGDYEQDVRQKVIRTRTGQLGALNRIALVDNLALVARSTAVVQSALDVAGANANSLAQAPEFAALANALYGSDMAAYGDLVGAFLMDGAALVESMQPGSAPDAGQSGQALPLYDAAAFATYHGEGASNLLLLVAFPPGTDAALAAATLADRLPNYVSLTGRPLADRWQFDSSGSLEVDGIPVAYVAMRIPDPTSPDGRILAWQRLIFMRDFGFLAVG